MLWGFQVGTFFRTVGEGCLGVGYGNRLSEHRCRVA
jgi:hypothetical protein